MSFCLSYLFIDNLIHCIVQIIYSSFIESVVLIIEILYIVEYKFLNRLSGKFLNSKLKNVFLKRERK